MPQTQVVSDTDVLAQASTASFPLALAGAGERVRIVELGGGQGMAKRLDAMGLRPGTEFQILQREGPGGMVVLVAATRLALGMGMLHKIRVCKLS